MRTRQNVRGRQNASVCGGDSRWSLLNARERWRSTAADGSDSDHRTPIDLIASDARVPLQRATCVPQKVSRIQRNNERSREGYNKRPDVDAIRPLPLQVTLKSSPAQNSRNQLRIVVFLDLRVLSYSGSISRRVIGDVIFYDSCRAVHKGPHIFLARDRRPRRGPADGGAPSYRPPSLTRCTYESP